MYDISHDLVKHYDSASWREIVRRYPRSPEAEEARKRLETLSVVVVR
jgi:TolA-binding protein